MTQSAVDLDCGDNSCVFAKNKGGMRTNGGCRCLSNHGYSRSAISAAYSMLPEIIGLKMYVKRLEDLLDEAQQTVTNLKKRIKNESNS